MGMINENNVYKYEERIIAFIDILGFKNLVYDPKLIKAFSVVFNHANRNLMQNDLSMAGVQSTSISDSIVISIKANEEDAFKKLLQLIYAEVVGLLKLGIILRGAIAVGDLYHRNNIVFGPALVNAYEYEKENAIYPRIIVDSGVLNRCLNLCKSDMDCKIQKGYFKEDSDGYLFFDYMYTLFSIKYRFNELDYEIKCIKEFLESQTPTSNNVKQKYNWLKKYYNSTLERIENEHSIDLKESKIKING